ncbi:MAG: hypothetical protein RUMPE_00068 [Eubacteriales bacterium SKADARSKE-1]|nr:hypothetical protein [Eubacteriales bacterium SKADARSKE-1]
MKKVLSSVLTITMLISTIGPAAVFADGSEPNDSSVTATKGYVGLAKDYVVSKAKSSIKNANENKGKYAIVAGGAILSAAAAVAAMYYCKGSDSALAAENLNDSKLGQSKPVIPDLDTKAGKEAPVDSAIGTDTQSTETINLASGAELGQTQLAITEQTLSNKDDMCLPGGENICLQIDEYYTVSSSVKTNATNTQSTEETTIADDSKLGQSQLAIPAPSLKYDLIGSVETTAKNASAITATGNDEQKLDTKVNASVPVGNDITDDDDVTYDAKQVESIGFWDSYKPTVICAVIMIPILIAATIYSQIINTQKNLLLGNLGRLRFTEQNIQKYFDDIPPRYYPSANRIFDMHKTFTEIENALNRLCASLKS